MLPLLRLAGDGREHSLREAVDALTDEFGLTEQERRELLPSGRQATFDNRVAWARTYLKKAGLLDSPRRGYLRITERGRDVLSKDPPEINNSFLSRFVEFVEFRTPRSSSSESAAPPRTIEQAETPEEVVETAYEEMREELAGELLESIKKCSPEFFERLVLDLLVKMGYGGTRKDAGEAVGRSGDGGIDGIIKEDRLGLDTVYLQAKRWDGTVGRPEIQKFAGALQGQRARKGVFITTSAFSKESLEYASAIDSTIILIDGETLAGLMIDYNIGVTSVASYELKRLDADYFTED